MTHACMLSGCERRAENWVESLYVCAMHAQRKRRYPATWRCTKGMCGNKQAGRGLCEIHLEEEERLVRAQIEWEGGDSSDIGRRSEIIREMGSES